jgi:2-methylisocitrate lyase-like PEP mutase family enzyme
MLFPTSDEEWRDTPSLLDCPVVAMAALDARPVADWAELGWAMVIDPFSGQVVALDAVRSLYSRQAAGGDATEEERAARFAVYRQLPAIAGLDALYDIERRTTEPGT